MRQNYLKAFSYLEEKKILKIILLLIMLIMIIAISFNLGRYSINPIRAIKILFSQLFIKNSNYSNIEKTIVMDIRLPRILGAIIVGGGLSVSGGVYQGVFRNPIVSPDILGALAGGSFGAAMGILTFNTNMAIGTLAFVFSLISVIISLFISKLLGRGVNNLLLLILSGMVVGTMFQSAVAIIKYMADPDSTLPTITYWLMGSLSKTTMGDLSFYIITFLIGFIPIYLIRSKLNVISFGEEEAIAMGINYRMYRNISIICSTILVATAVSMAGVIGWVGLMIPHLVRFIFGSNNKYLVPGSLLVGGIFMIIVDNICRCTFSYEIPLGIITSIIGGPFFLILILKKGVFNN